MSVDYAGYNVWAKTKDQKLLNNAIWLEYRTEYGHLPGLVPKICHLQESLGYGRERPDLDAWHVVTMLKIKISLTILRRNTSAVFKSQV